MVNVTTVPKTLSVQDSKHWDDSKTNFHCCRVSTLWQTHNSSLSSCPGSTVGDPVLGRTDRGWCLVRLHKFLYTSLLVPSGRDLLGTDRHFRAVRVTRTV